MGLGLTVTEILASLWVGWWVENKEFKWAKLNNVLGRVVGRYQSTPVQANGLVTSLV